MTAPVQPTLDGTLPESSQLSYAEWVDRIRPAIVAMARTGQRFTVYEAAKEHNLIEPRNPRADWGNATQQFEREGLIEHCGFDRSSRPTGEKSAVAVWRGTHAAHTGRVA
jgi:hypothetical protein